MNRLYMGLLFLLLLSYPAAAQDRQTVLLAAHRTGRVEVFDPATLAPIGSIHVLPLANGISNSPDGSMLYISEGIAPDFKGCCVLYALDLETKRMTRVVTPASGATVSPDGNTIVTQRGAVGIEIYGARTLAPESPIAQSIAPGAYELSFSPDGRLLFGLTEWQGPALDVFDFSTRKLVRKYPVPVDGPLRGAWVRDDFYLYSHKDLDGRLWKINLESPTLGQPLTISFPRSALECGPFYFENVVGADNRLFLYEAFGMKLDRRLKCKTPVSGGVYSVDLQNGRLLRPFASSVHFNSVIASFDGKDLYGIDVRNLSWDSVALVRLDAETGKILAKRELAPDYWFIALAALPRKLVPQGDVDVSVN